MDRAVAGAAAALVAEGVASAALVAVATSGAVARAAAGSREQWGGLLIWFFVAQAVSLRVR